jgi:hypothetical protein
LQEIEQLNDYTK